MLASAARGWLPLIPTRAAAVKPAPSQIALAEALPARHRGLDGEPARGDYGAPRAQKHTQHRNVAAESRAVAASSKRRGNGTADPAHILRERGEQWRAQRDASQSR